MSYEWVIEYGVQIESKNPLEIRQPSRQYSKWHHKFKVGSPEIHS
jgi:hypothetical protein